MNWTDTQLYKLFKKKHPCYDSPSELPDWAYLKELSITELIEFLNEEMDCAQKGDWFALDDFKDGVITLGFRMGEDVNPAVDEDYIAYFQRLAGIHRRNSWNPDLNPFIDVLNFPANIW